ncbi:F-box/LRR-repeat protein fbxl-1-like [Galleria mellonella]|uniref:F-box/LRR-repeat protein fbxl-1-like n=1 Tax=Galleria mellonella TaxID=7137 RepID=A0A6J1WT51_GALME|nr:F-box/LRR-repeat protein fbxl-1-like [Galleria mellonella]
MDLPYEVLVYLFKFLPKSDRISASETCRSWYLAANDHFFMKNKVAVFYKSVLNDEDTSPVNVFENSLVTHQNYIFNEVEISSKLNAFWDKMGESIKSLTLRNCDICEKVFVYLLQKCTSLEELNIQCCRELFMSGRLLEGKSEGLLEDNLDNLRILSLSGNQYLTDALFNRFVMATPALEKLNLSACSLQFHLGLVKKFYPPGTDIFKNPSESVLTFYFVLQFIISRAENIKCLLFSNTLIDGAALKLLSEIKNLKLESLEVHSCDQLTNTGILALTNHQTSLKELDIGLCTRVTDQSLVYICKNLVSLEYLNIQRCRAVTDLGIAELRKLKKLRSLNISQCELITKDGLEKGLCAEENKTIEDLNIHSLNLDQTALIMISEKMPNLRALDISYCFNAVTDTSIQVIFKNQILLHTLKLSHCDKVSDAGLTGMGKVEAEGDDEGPIMSTYDDASSNHKIPLGSRAEEEIVRDAKRKRDVKLMCEKLTMDTFTGYSLARMKGLKKLDVSGCNRITDVSLTYAFNFKELVNLNLSRCQQITHVGIEHLVKNCPSIEYFNLTDCYNLKDEAVKEIVKALRRLKQLELRGCNQLTDRTLEPIRSHCEKLKFLDVQGCRYISPELACSIGSLPTLHTVLMSKPGPYITDGVKNRSPAPTFLPALMRKLRLH